LAKADAQAALDSFTGAFQKQLKKGDEVTIIGFGKFSVTKRVARTGRDPQTGESLKIKASKTRDRLMGQARGVAPCRDVLQVPCSVCHGVGLDDYVRDGDRELVAESLDDAGLKPI
jgi:nucleoid DNA-binding protein